jgi:hypothetical protein
MTLFIKLENDSAVGYPIAETNFLQLFPLITFPREYTADVVEPFGYGIFDFTNAPICDRYEKAVELTPTRNQFGIWTQTWQVLQMNDDEKLAEDAMKQREVRSERARRLAETDWRFRSDLVVSQAWVDYCQALRDVPTQAGFPWDIQWPAQP